MNWMLLVLLLIVLASVVYYCLILVPAYTAIVIMNRITGALRSCGSGLNELWPWEEIEKGSETPLKLNNYSFKAEFKTKDELPVTLTVSFHAVPHERHIVEYRGFDGETRIDGISDYLKFFMTILVREKENFDQVMDNLEELAKALKDKFEGYKSESGKPLQVYFGTNLKATMISADLPEELQEAAVKKEVTTKENARRESEMEKLKEIARGLVKESKNEMPFQSAMDIVQLQFSDDVKKNIQIHGLDAGTRKTLENIAANLGKLLVRGKK